MTNLKFPSGVYLCLKKFNLGILNKYLANILKIRFKIKNKKKEKILFNGNFQILKNLIV